MAKVNFLKNPVDLEVMVLGSLGFSTDFIVAKTGLSTGQVLYRLGKSKVKRVDYRNGRTPEAGIVIRAVRSVAITNMSRKARSL